jgi:excisionase family DNA binding protein
MSNKDEQNEKDLTEKEVAEILRVSVRTLQIWRANGKAPKCYRHGFKGVRYRYADVMAWKENLILSQNAEDL